MLLLRALPRADHHERPAGHADHGGGGHRPHPVARVAHRAELPLGKLLGREIGQLGEVALEPVGQRLGRLDGGERGAQQGFHVVAGVSHP